jgi:hypothetical protein
LKAGVKKHGGEEQEAAAKKLKAMADKRCFVMPLYYNYDKFHYKTISPYPSGISRAAIKANREAYDHVMIQLANHTKDGSGNIKSIAQLRTEALALYPLATGLERYDNPPIEPEKTVA